MERIVVHWFQFLKRRVEFRLFSEYCADDKGQIPMLLLSWASDKRLFVPFHILKNLASSSNPNTLNLLVLPPPRKSR